MTTKITDKNISSIANLFVSWQSVITADGSTTTTGVAGRGYFINTTSAAHTFILPTIATAGDTISIKDYAGSFATNKLTIDRNGHNIQGAANNSLVGTNRAAITLVYIDVTRGWEYVKESNVANLETPVFTSATGGTITTSGDYKIHTFTGDGSFVVSQLGNAPTVPTGGPNTVSYLVVAGGGNGAGGFREGRDITPSYTASPLVAPTGLTITTTTYPITVGGGAPSPCASPTQGSPSVFSTITSTGGGSYATPGGSGGGANNTTPGSGNTPPVSPPQGNPGGPNVNGQSSSGGGGATEAGQPNNGPFNPGGRGGAGATTSITGSPLAYAGGGGGNANAGLGFTGGPASPCGTGGRGSGVGVPTGDNGTINRGGGGGVANGIGGSGVVVIRYKFQ